MDKIKRMYNILLKEYGPQNWWPVTDKGKLKPAYKSRRLLTEKQKFEVCVGAILTQNTSWKNVEKAVENLNRHNLLDIKKIKNIKKDKLAQLIKSSGYYNQKAERLKIFSHFFSKNKNPTRQELLNLKGIGPETADSILLYAFKKPLFVIDAYTKRVFERSGFKAEDYGGWQEIFMKNLKKDPKLFSEYHALIVELAKQYCKKNPDCNGCPLINFCRKKL